MVSSPTQAAPFSFEKRVVLVGVCCFVCYALALHPLIHGKKGLYKKTNMLRVSHCFIVSSGNCVRLRGGGWQWLIFTFYCLDFPSSSSSLSLHYIVGLIAGGLETIRVSVLRCHCRMGSRMSCRMGSRL